MKKLCNGQTSLNIEKRDSELTELISMLGILKFGHAWFWDDLIKFFVCLSLSFLRRGKMVSLVHYHIKKNGLIDLY